MPADKKINREKLPHPEKTDKKHRGQEEFDDKNKDVKERTKTRKINYIIKDLPIY
jgi:hypothetical protein